MNEKITVGYDGTASSVESVMWAVNEAGVRGVPLRVVSCFGVPALAGGAALGWGAGEAFDAARSAADIGLVEIRATIAAVHPDLAFTTELSSAPVDVALLAEAGADDVVVVGGSSSRLGAAAFWLGSTPRDLVHHSPCAIVVVRGGASRGGPDRIVVGADGSAASDRAVRWAADEADLHHTTLLVVHSWKVPYGDDVAGRDVARIDAAVVLERAVESARERCGATVESRFVEGGPVAGLLDAVRDGDLLVLGSRGRGPVRSGLFGSTANSVLDAAAVPVVVVREHPVDEHDVPSPQAAALAAATR